MSVDEVRCWKPAAAPYLHAAAACDVPPEQMAMVAAHGWDVHGARHAGLVTAWVSRLEDTLPAVFGRRGSPRARRGGVPLTEQFRAPRSLPT